MNSRDLKTEIDIIENKKNKYYLIGFVLGIIPYLIIIGISKILGITSSFIYLLMFIAIITAFINAHILSKQILKRLIEFFNLTNEIDYFQAKENIDF